MLFFAAWIKQLYSYEQDATAISPEASAAFLSQLAVQQQQLQQLAATLMPGAKSLVGSKVSSIAGQTKITTTTKPANTSAQGQNIDIAPFIRVATDVLNYLRFCRSNALLQLLQEFAATGQLDVQSADPDELQSEIEKLLNLENLNRWYLASGRSDGVGRSSAISNLSTVKSAVQV
jgi:hypothetical protein